jgi:arylsulfatase A-like enzyme
MVESLDVEFKRLLNAVDRAGVAEDTIVCYSSDHGDMIGSHGYMNKCWPYEASARVPFLIRYPRAIPPGQVINHPFSTIDVHPTLASLASVQPAAGIDGRDYSSLLTGKTSRPPRDYAYLEMAYGFVPWPGWRALRTAEYSYARTAKGPWFLTNIIKDPYQVKNLAGERSSRALVAEMDKRLAAIMKETADSWDYHSTGGDVERWAPDSRTHDDEYLGVSWPGRQIPPIG